MDTPMQEKLMRVDLEKADVHQFLSAYLFNEAIELSSALHQQVFAKALLAAAKKHNDRVAEELVSLLGRSYELTETRGLWNQSKPQELRAALERADGMFRQHLRELYWQLPDVRIVTEVSGRRLEQPERDGTLLKTKLLILCHIIGDWTPKPTKESVEAFWFIIAASQSWPHSIPPREGASGYELKARGRFVSPKEHDDVVQLVRKHAGTSPFTPEKLELWIEQPLVPDEILRALVMARARHGGPELAKRDIRNARLLQRFKSDERSPDALRLLERLGGSAAHLDTATSKLPVMMQPDNDRANAEHIGSSEYVLGKIAIWYDNLTQIRVSVQLPDDCPEELGRDVFGRARRHLDSWLLTHGWFAARLWVIGGRGNLDLGYPADPAQYAGGPFHPTAEQPRA